jgi:hypothetical protein
MTAETQRLHREEVQTRALLKAKVHGHSDVRLVLCGHFSWIRLERVFAQTSLSSVSSLFAFTAFAIRKWWFAAKNLAFQSRRKSRR